MEAPIDEEGLRVKDSATTDATGTPGTETTKLMTEVPKIVYDRLRAAGPERSFLGQSMLGQSVPGPTAAEPAHPNADLLTAFAEQALSATERDGVLEHLALCVECRDVVALALPAMDIAAVPTAADTETVRTATPAKPHWSWLSSPRLAWPGLRWAALAAGVALAASVLLLPPGKLNQATLPSAKQVAATAPPEAVQQTPSSPIASPPPSQSSVSANAAPVGGNGARTKLELSPSKKVKAASPPEGQSGMLLAYNTKSAIPANKGPAASTPPSAAFEPGESASRSTTEAVEVAAATEAVTVAPSPEDTLMARNAAPAIEKAKPAPIEAEVNESQKTQAAHGTASARLQERNVMSAAKMAPSTNQALVPNATWTIKAGVLQRSWDSGQSWQNALRTDHPLLCYTSHLAEVWAGGQAGALFHSVDDGVTWLQLRPSSKGKALSSDVTHIDIRGDPRGSVEIVVSTHNNETWSSVDAGTTWEKK